ncbi:MAG: cytochrome c maturation protein CcmE [Flavobacteriales bacterium]
MRKIEIALIIVVAVAIGFIFTYSTEASRYGNFTEAFAESGKTYKIIGTLNKDIPVETPQANLVIFNMIDKEGKEMKVYLNETVQEHFDRSDQVVVTGTADPEKNAFFATEHQAKCPSKYNDEK